MKYTCMDYSYEEGIWNIFFIQNISHYPNISEHF